MASKEKHEYGQSEDHDEKGSRIVGVESVPLPECLASLSEEERNKIRKKATLKLDAVILTGVVIMYILNYLDRQNISSARLAGIQEDLNLSDTQYQTAISILFVGYILFQIPSNAIASSVPDPALYINVMMALWGVLSACTAAVQGYGGLLAVRILIGVIECAFFPGAIYYITTFYSRSQLAVRTAILYSGSQLGNAFGGLIAIGILKLDGTHGIAGWRWLFLIEGVLTIGIACVFGLVLPSSPRKTKMLNEVERASVLYHFEMDECTVDDAEKVGSWQGVVMAVTDLKSWLFVGILSITYVSGAVVQFFPSVVETLGYDRNTTLALTAPPYLLCCITMIINGLHSDKKQERFLHCVWPQLLIILANVIAVATLNTGARYFAMMLMPTSTYASAVIVLSWIGSTLNEPSKKRACAYALVNSFGNTPNVYMSYAYVGEPRYYAAFGTNLGAGVAVVCLTTFTYFYLKRENQRLDNGEDVKGVTEQQKARGYRFIL